MTMTGTSFTGSRPSTSHGTPSRPTTPSAAAAYLPSYTPVATIPSNPPRAATISRDTAAAAVALARSTTATAAGGSASGGRTASAVQFPAPSQFPTVSPSSGPLRTAGNSVVGGGDDGGVSHHRPALNRTSSNREGRTAAIITEGSTPFGTAASEDVLMYRCIVSALCSIR